MHHCNAPQESAASSDRIHYNVCEKCDWACMLAARCLPQQQAGASAYRDARPKPLDLSSAGCRPAASAALSLRRRALPGATGGCWLRMRSFISCSSDTPGWRRRCQRGARSAAGIILFQSAGQLNARGRHLREYPRQTRSPWPPSFIILDMVCICTRMAANSVHSCLTSASVRPAPSATRRWRLGNLMSSSGFSRS